MTSLTTAGSGTLRVAFAMTSGVSLTGSFETRLLVGGRSISVRDLWDQRSYEKGILGLSTSVEPQQVLEQQWQEPLLVAFTGISEAVLAGSLGPRQLRKRVLWLRPWLQPLMYRWHWSLGPGGQWQLWVTPWLKIWLDGVVLNWLKLKLFTRLGK